jgi:mannose-6-phosphate isomerase-like protein (cupin superfamily)
VRITAVSTRVVGAGDREGGAMAEARTDEDMTIVRTITPESRPSWSDVTSAGTFRVEPNGRFDLHYHDCDEYWLVFGGRAIVRVGATTYTVGPGDIVCTPTGTQHDVVAVGERLEAFWFEAATAPGGRIGHLHRTPEDAEGHVVPPMPTT